MGLGITSTCGRFGMSAGRASVYEIVAKGLALGGVKFVEAKLPAIEAELDREKETLTPAAERIWVNETRVAYLERTVKNLKPAAVQLKSWAKPTTIIYAQLKIDCHNYAAVPAHPPKFATFGPLAGVYWWCSGRDNEFTLTPGMCADLAATFRNEHVRAGCIEYWKTRDDLSDVEEYYDEYAQFFGNIADANSGVTVGESTPTTRRARNWAS